MRDVALENILNTEVFKEEQSPLDSEYTMLLESSLIPNRLWIKWVTNARGLKIKHLQYKDLVMSDTGQPNSFMGMGVKFKEL